MPKHHRPVASLLDQAAPEVARVTGAVYEALAQESEHRHNEIGCLMNDMDVLTSQQRLAGFMSGHHAMARMLADLLPSVEERLFFSEDTVAAVTACLSTARQAVAVEAAHQERHQAGRALKAEENKANYAAELQELMQEKQQAMAVYEARGEELQKELQEAEEYLGKHLL
eukprot:TRINITY_DN5210_c0_g1_i1.p1 TRINITY_DN5210_c0_g1~~TRINITY_DN5210_c0_g1_i1.p1  ORF type:complete len:170 (-),score=60.65 TRINITY_DN5210_c0_g1_i1:390-899(-)